MFIVRQGGKVASIFASKAQKKILITIIAFLVFSTTKVLDCRAATVRMPADCANLRACFSLMDGGDTLIIADGAYTGENNRINWQNLPPNGTPAAWTNIEAEHPGHVQFDGQNARRMLGAGSEEPDTPMNYVTFRGLEWINSTGGHDVTGDSHNNHTAHHIKFFQCGFEDSMGINYASYILLEDCYVWGRGRYNFIPFVSDHVIFRRCVARLDAADGNNMPICNYQNYDSQFVEYQNCIAIDSSDDYYTNFEGINGGFSVRHPIDIYRDGITYTYRSENVGIRGLIVLNVKNERSGFGSPAASWVFGWDVINTSIEDAIFWDMHRGTYFSYTYPDTNYAIRNAVFGQMSESGDNMVWGNFGQYGDISNSIFANISGTALGKVKSSTKNAFYANGTNKDGVTSSSGDITNVNPFTVGGLKYLPRVESDGSFHGAGVGGEDIGPDITKRIGVSGTLYGEAGYNAITNESLWPWPNEDIIKHAFSTYGVQSNPNPRRGFCADGNGLYGGPVTLTSYIWEYLGNPCPVEICSPGQAGDATPPAVPAGLSVR